MENTVFSSRLLLIKVGFNIGCPIDAYDCFNSMCKFGVLLKRGTENGTKWKTE